MSVDVAFRGVTDSCKIHGTRTMAAYRLLLRRDKSARALCRTRGDFESGAVDCVAMPDIRPKRRQLLRFALPAEEEALSLFLFLFLFLSSKWRNGGSLRAYRDLVIKYA